MFVSLSGKAQLTSSTHAHLVSAVSAACFATGVSERLRELSIRGIENQKKNNHDIRGQHRWAAAVLG